ncbi:MAG: RND transporter [Rhodocyclaceae bacterium]|nr:MAG: RND transporter [Rhodocyclaceae bacterium]
MTFQRILTPILCAAVFALPVSAMAADEHSTHMSAHASPVAATTKMVEGTVKKVNQATGKVTLAHGPLANLGMPAMTMVFRVKDNAWLNQMKEGDKINFIADKVNGALTVTQFEVAK